MGPTQLVRKAPGSTSKEILKQTMVIKTGMLAHAKNFTQPREFHAHAVE